MTTTEQTLDGWLDNHQHEIEEAKACAADVLPDDQAAFSEALALTRALSVRIGSLANELVAVVNCAHADAIRRVRKEFEDYSAKEREIFAKADPEYLSALRVKDEVDGVVSALRAKHFEAMNARRNTYDPQAQRGGQ